MRGIYISQDLSHAGGIQDKIFKQIMEFNKSEIEVDKWINPKRNIAHLLLNTAPFCSVQYFHTKKIVWKNYDFAYVRKGAIFDKSFITMIAKAKTQNPKIKIIVEVPTYPYLDEFKGLLKLDITMKEKKWVPFLAKYVDRIVTYSDDTKIYGIPCIKISNAYQFEKPPVVTEHSQAGIHLLGVAALCFYHGYDRVIEGLKKYNQSAANTPKVYFTLVGDGPVLNDYKKLIKEYQLENYITLTGKKDFQELAPFYAQADIGIDSLARHRSGVRYNSSLKGKEYLANGLPIVSGVQTDLDDLDFEYYFRVPANDTPLDIPSIIKWYEKITANKSKSELAKTIFNFGEQHFTFSKTFKPVVDYVKGE
jgi:glycosyltransferase involved in cell wall biosynthesis